MNEYEFNYKNVFDEMVDAVIIIEVSTGSIVDSNKSCSQLLGYKKSELFGNHISLLFEPDAADEKSKLFPEKFMYGNVLHNRYLKTKKGETIPVDLTISICGEQSDNYIMISLRDISERLRYENTILQINEELKDANLSKDKLFSIIAHDLKNPMMTLMGLSEIIFEDVKEISLDEIKQMANTINLLSKDTYDLLDNLLNWARVQIGKILVERRELNLFNIASKILDTLKPSAELKKVELINQVPQNYFLNADENMIKTIIRNLVSNSIKFSKEGTRVTVKTFNDSKLKTIMVEDQGVGMEESYAAELFKPSVQTSRYGTNNEKGTGLGLLICSEFVKLHNGEIKVISEIGKGSQFIIHLPE